MTEFSVIKPTDKFLYWYEIAKYVAPFATVGSFLLSGFSYLNAIRQERRLDQIAKQLRQIKSLIVTMERQIIDKLNDQALKNRSGEVLSYREFLEEQAIIQDSVALNFELSNMRTTKHKIITYLGDSETPLDYKASYCGLLLSVFSMRIAAFECLDLELEAINTLALDEITELLSYEETVRECLEEVGERRVHSFEDNRILIDELGPIWGTQWSVMIDNRGVGLGFYIPGSSDLNEERDKVHARVDELRSKHAAAAFEPFKKAFAGFSKARDELIAEQEQASET